MIFFNREPVEEDMKRWEKLYYVGEDAKESRYCREIYWWISTGAIPTDSIWTATER